ncbi:lea domain-containing protein [Pochonia chlamydosporia 170]|uniref:Lea domain-containing protein n=1 Tax=Pochonia chlamydosporia 170 TaxID=1380566 RepID=A0A179FIK7_METCM|nr:lea domain-containing protein [Pochonia chlamydosporia 170]OAQ65406.2 lea domain-containing protein [Pochonia chlamydosporia 170]
MFNDISKPPPPLPSPKLAELDSGIHILNPLSRRGDGPGIILLTLDYADQLTITNGVPSPIMKWAEEGYVVVEVQQSALERDCGKAIAVAIKAIAAHDKCNSSKVGLVGKDVSMFFVPVVFFSIEQSLTKCAAYKPEVWNRVVPVLHQFEQIVGAVVYSHSGFKDELATPSIPVLQHIAGKASGPSKRSDALTVYHYSSVAPEFAVPFQPDFHYNSESLSHTRNLKFLKPLMDGPYFDLETIWDEHTYYEFADRSVEHTMSTMVAEPYVNHVPTLTGGIGRERLTTFYRDNFIFNNSADTDLELISRTVGIDRVIDEFIFKTTHDQEVDWLLPGVPPTNRKLEIPFTAVVNIRGDRLYHEHISWDQGTALRQLGLLPEYLPFPYALPDGRTPAPGKKFEYKVPVLGLETVEKMRDKNSVESNELFGGKIREF